MDISRKLDEGMGQAVGERTYLRPIPLKDQLSNPVRLNPSDPNQQRWYQILSLGGVEVLYDNDAPYTAPPVRGEDYRYETWEELSVRVAFGNASLVPSENMSSAYHLIREAVMLPAGRHLQHGDYTQPSRPQTVFTNCATAPAAWLRYYLLLNGSGVGRSIDDDVLLVDWDKAPAVQCVLDERHADFQWGGLFLSTQEAKHRFGHGERVHWHVVDDSREGWARALEVWEMMTWEMRHRDSLLILDFSQVRRNGAPIKGMQGRPSSGPVPTMAAFHKAAAGIGSGLPRWLQTLYVEHYFSESVLVGGARRASGMITKNWRDAGVLDFARIKMPAEYRGLTMEEITQHRAEHGPPIATPLWTSNHSVAVDDEFWWLLGIKRGQDGYSSSIARHARQVFRVVTETAYATGSGEPGFINVSKLNVSHVGEEYA